MQPLLQSVALKFGNLKGGNVQYVKIQYIPCSVRGETKTTKRHEKCDKQQASQQAINHIVH